MKMTRIANTMEAISVTCMCEWTINLNEGQLDSFRKKGGQCPQSFFPCRKGGATRVGQSVCFL